MTTKSIGTTELPGPSTETGRAGAVDDRSIDPQRGTWIAAAIIVGLAAAVLIPYVAIWGTGSLNRGWQGLPSGVLLLGVLVGTVAHEGLHALAWMLAGGLGRADVAFAVNWKVLTPYAHAKVPLPARAYRIGVVAPGLLLGVLPAAVALAYDLPALMIFAAFFTIAAAGDLLILLLLRGVPGTARVMDHPTRWGCAVIA